MSLGIIADMSGYDTCPSLIHVDLQVLFMAMPLSVLGNAMSQTWADRHRIVLITQTRRKLKNLGYTAEHMPKLFSKFDKDGNGELEMDEFCDLVAKMRIGTQTLRRNFLR